MTWHFDDFLTWHKNKWDKKKDETPWIWNCSVDGKIIFIIISEKVVLHHRWQSNKGNKKYYLNILE